jgi:hypothetical protein
MFVKLAKENYCYRAYARKTYNTDVEYILNYSIKATTRVVDGTHPIYYLNRENLSTVSAIIA